MGSRPHLLPHQPHFFNLWSLAFTFGVGGVLSPSSEHPVHHFSGKDRLGQPQLASIYMRDRESQERNARRTQGHSLEYFRGGSGDPELKAEAVFYICPQTLT